MNESAQPLPSDVGRGARSERRVLSQRLETFLQKLYEGETPNAGSFCSFCYNPLPPGYERCDHCGQSTQDRPPVDTLPQDVIDMFRRKQKRESLIVNSFAYLGLGLGLAIFLGMVAINVLLMKALWFFILATIVLMFGTRLLAGIVGGVIGDELGFRYASRKLAEEWSAHVHQRETGISRNT